VTPEFVDLCRNRYRVIFYLEPVRFQKNYYRTEDDKTAKEIGELIYDVYSRQLNYEVVNIPVISIAKKLDIILENIQ